MKLEHWSVRSRPWGHLEPPEQEGSCLYGLVIGHPLHQDGKEVLTSPVTDPDPAYERLYPEARQRLLARLDAGSPQPEALAAAAA